MKIIEYEEKYLEDVKDLLVELEEYILILDLEEVNENNGKCYIAVEDDKAIGVIMGTIIKYDEYDYLDYTCPKTGEITELIVSQKVRSKGVGQQLMQKMEEYFKSQNCEYVHIDVFAYNETAINFYRKQGYHTRMFIDIKKL